MNSEIQVFKDERFGSIRTVNRGGEVWFVGRDVAAALGYGAGKSLANAVANHVDGEDKGVTELMTPGGMQKTVIINESGLYSLILSSKLPSAREFKRWVTHEVIPSIRKHGAYMTDAKLSQLLANPEQAHLLVMELVQEKVANERLTAELADAIPKARYYDTFVNPRECTNIRVTAKELGIPEKRFTRYLLTHGYLYRAPSGKLMPYVKYYAMGFFIIRDFHLHHSPEVGHYTLFTARGKEHFMYLTNQILKETA